MKVASCPLCQSEEVSLVDRVDTDDLVQLYRARFGVAVADHFDGIDQLSFFNCSSCHLRFFSPMIAGSQSFYQQLNRHPWYYLEEKSEYRTVANLIPRGAKVLDIGCGEGKFARFLPACEYVGLEMNLTASVSKGDDAPTILDESIADHSKRQPGHYDFVCSFQVLEHVVDLNGFITDSLKCLRSGGRLVVSVPAADSFIAQTINGLLNMPPHHLTWWPDHTLSHIAVRYGLVLERLIHEPLERLHYRRYAFNKAWALIGRRFRLIDRTPFYRLGSLLLLPVAVIGWLMLIFNSSATIHGHSVVAVYRNGNQE